MDSSQRLRRMFGRTPAAHCTSWDELPEGSLPGLTGFLLAAEPARHQILCLVNPFLANRLLGFLRAAQRVPEEAILAGRLQMQTSREPFLRGERLAGQMVTAFLREQQTRALRAGATGLWCVLEMAWLGGGSAGLTDLKELEWLLHDFPALPSTRFLCHYDLTRFPPDFLGSILEMHEVLTCGELGGPNPYFTFFRATPDATLAGQILQHRREVLQRWFSGPALSATSGDGLEVAGASPQAGGQADPGPAAGAQLFPKALQTLFAREVPLIRALGDLLADARRVTQAAAGLAAVLDPYTETLVVRVVDPPLNSECQAIPGAGPAAILRPAGPLTRLTSHVLVSGKGFFTNDFRQHPLVKGTLPEDFPWGRIMVLPFFTDRDPSGILLLVKAEGEFGAVDLLRGQEFSQAFGLAVVRSQLQTQMAMLEAMVQRTTAAIAVTTAQGRVLSWNPCFETLAGRVPSVERPMVLPDDLLTPSAPTLAAVREALRLGKGWEGRLRVPTPSASEAGLMVTVTPFAQEEGEGSRLLIWVFPEVPGVGTTAEASVEPGALSNLQTVMADFQKGLAEIVGNVEMLRLSFGESGAAEVETIREIKGAVDRVWNLMARMKRLFPNLAPPRRDRPDPEPRP